MLGAGAHPPTRQEPDRVERQPEDGQQVAVQAPGAHPAGGGRHDDRTADGGGDPHQQPAVDPLTEVAAGEGGDHRRLERVDQRRR